MIRDSLEGKDKNGWNHHSSCQGTFAACCNIAQGYQKNMGPCLPVCSLVTSRMVPSDLDEEPHSDPRYNEPHPKYVFVREYLRHHPC